ncbi:MAG: ATP-binding protein [Bacteroidales bacterium]|nr:ATP-binding protein [Bacteroidales bacterium]
MVRIAVTGPESSGKTTLAEALHEVLDSCFVPEFSRDYFHAKSYLNYTINDVVSIGKQQFKSNGLSDCDKPYLICDTEMLVIKIWCEDKFGFIPEIVVDLYEQQQFDLFLLCKPDFPWHFDPLREDENRREELYAKYLRYLRESKHDFVEVEGPFESRIAKVLEIMNQFKQ